MTRPAPALDPRTLRFIADEYDDRCLRHVRTQNICMTQYREKHERLARIFADEAQRLRRLATRAERAKR